jgi:hypothetical protein
MLSELIGQHFGLLEVTGIEYKGGYIAYRCLCGNVGRTTYKALRNGKADCGDYKTHRAKKREAKHVALQGQKIGRWTVLLRIA